MGNYNLISCLNKIKLAEGGIDVSWVHILKPVSGIK